MWVSKHEAEASKAKIRESVCWGTVQEVFVKNSLKLFSIRGEG